MLSLDTNAGQVADDLSSVVSPAIADGDEEAARYALALVDRKTPRRTGALAAGLRSDVVPDGGFAVTDPVPYATVVDARTGFASETLVEADAAIADIYDQHLQAAFDTIT